MKNTIPIFGLILILSSNLVSANYVDAQIIKLEFTWLSAILFLIFLIFFVWIVLKFKKIS